MMLWTSLLGTLLILGFAHIIWVISIKEAPTTKLIGQILAIAITVLIVVLFLYGGVYGGLMGRGGYGMHGMMGPGMMGKGMMGPEYMDKMMKSPEMKKWMEEYGRGKRK
ncbi:hypothetical protein HZC35_04510 [Candidatus Saganbacteria bacterium]|nr:hypothetical protein [Candidatus Saganbacteria bacterium]